MECMSNEKNINDFRKNKKRGLMDRDLTITEFFIHLFVLLSAIFVIGALPLILQWQENRKKHKKPKKHKRR